MDFVHDQLATGRKIRILTVVDTFTRYSPVIDPRFTYRSENVVEALDKACARLGYPKAIRVDQGTEFVSRNLDLWAYAFGVTGLLQVGQADGQRLHRRLQRPLPGRVCGRPRFLTLADAAEKLEAWREDYNEVRPHGHQQQAADRFDESGDTASLSP